MNDQNSADVSTIAGTEPGSNVPAAAPAAPRRLRLWPAVIILIAQWLVYLIPGWIAPMTPIQFFGWMGGAAFGALGISIWWLFASRIRWSERLLVMAVFAGGGFALTRLADPSFFVMAVIIYALPIVTTVWLLWLLATGSLSWPIRRAGLCLVLALTWACFALVRFEGTDGSINAKFNFRWRRTSEEQFLAEHGTGKPASEGKSISPVAAIELEPGDWPGFRGPARDGRLTGVRIASDWKARPPRQVWRRRVGPGWSSFAVIGPRLYTQEQRGPNEVVVCYDAATGAESWVHSDAVRFMEPMAGPGPRATPTFDQGKIYAQGAKGQLNCVDAADGHVIWSRDIVADSGAAVPMWGFSASPLITQGVVTTFAGTTGKSDKCVLAYDALTGKKAWTAGTGKLSYCSLHPARLVGVEQIMISTGQGLNSFDPKNGTILWAYDWPMDDENSARVVQPAIVGDSDFLIGASFGVGTRRVHVSHDKDQWKTDVKWTSKAIKPYFNDQVIHQDHLYGFDGNFFTCINLADGKAKWKERGYGNGQVLLLADQDLLLMLSEQGKVALIEAKPDKLHELGSFQAIEGKTWNHPVIARGKLFVRNGEEMACYELGEERATAAK